MTETMELFSIAKDLGIGVLALVILFVFIRNTRAGDKEESDDRKAATTAQMALVSLAAGINEQNALTRAALEEAAKQGQTERTSLAQNMWGLQKDVSEHNTLILDRLDVLEAEMKDLITQYLEYGKEKDKETKDILAQIETRWDALLSELRVIRDAVTASDERAASAAETVENIRADIAADKAAADAAADGTNPT